ncbi:MAG: hypothetical protein L0Y39_07765, partial [Methylococcaceae bacterium]|nr:hypothetical protein [Methylococcaceae bacterium]
MRMCFRPLRSSLETCEFNLKKPQKRLHEIEGALYGTELSTADRKDKLKASLRENSDLDRKIVESEEIWTRYCWNC